MNRDNWEDLLKRGLASDDVPGEELNRRIIQQYKERKSMKRTYRKRLSAGVLIAVLTMVMSVTAFAAVQLYNARQVAEHLGEALLAEAFESPDAIEINQTASGGGYQFTLHGIVSGTGLREFSSSREDVYPDRTYAVVSIAREDGSPMPDTRDEDYGQEPFFISPFIKGQKPWQINIFTMSGGYSEFVIDGTMYRLIECDGVEIFADRGVYLAISSGNRFYSNEAFSYDESTGEIQPKADYQGASLLFDLPLDQAKADYAKAEAYLNELLKEPSSDAAEEDALTLRMKELLEKIPEGAVIADSVKEVTYDDQGKIHYEYEGWQVSFLVEELFAEGQTGDSQVIHFSGGDDLYWALVFSRAESGVITGRIVQLN